MQRFARPITRGVFLRQLGGFCALALLDRSLSARDYESLRSAKPLSHPDPRPGITAERVLAPDKVGKSTKAAESYDGARAYPGLFDGIACGCGCGGANGEHRSLLVCFETNQPTGCQSCQEEALLVARLAKEGKSLADIRQAVDKQYS